jgi:hypothetical protein
MMRFDRLRIDFLLERLSTEKAGESKRNLFKVARDMLDLVVFLWLERDRFGNMKHDYDFVVRTRPAAYSLIC